MRKELFEKVKPLRDAGMTWCQIAYKVNYSGNHESIGAMYRKEVVKRDAQKDASRYVDRITKMLADGLSQHQVSQELKISRYFLNTIIADYKIKWDFRKKDIVIDEDESLIESMFKLADAGFTRQDAADILDKSYDYIRNLAKKHRIYFVHKKANFDSSYVPAENPESLCYRIPVEVKSIVMGAWV